MDLDPGCLPESPIELLTIAVAQTPHQTDSMRIYGVGLRHSFFKSSPAATITDLEEAAFW